MGERMWDMANLARCRWCNGEGHLIENCPDRQPLKVKIEEVIEEKKPWIKPKLTRWVKADVFTPCSQDVHKEGSVNTSTVHKDRKEYRREWMRKRRESEKANRVG